MGEPITSIPSANILLSSLRSVGYTPETAIADIVDNSLSANASAIAIEFDWQEQVIIISDNGDGMSEQELLKSMNIGSSDPLDSRSIHDLGRFGMGMKTASFSLGKKLTVLAKTGGIINNASWDLDYVRKEDKWQILVEDSSSTFIRQLSDRLSAYDNGTAVCISNIDKVISSDSANEKKKFYKMIENVKNVSAGTNNITSRINELNKAKNNLVEIISDLSAISEENAAATEQTNASMEELNATFAIITDSAAELQNLAHEMKATISYFRVEESSVSDMADSIEEMASEG